MFLLFGHSAVAVQLNVARPIDYPLTRTLNMTHKHR